MNQYPDVLSLWEKTRVITATFIKSLLGPRQCAVHVSNKMQTF